MNQALWMALANNAALLLALFVIYELSYLISKKRQIQNLLSGIFISAICIAIMSVPFRLATGVVFDTRSILISVSAMVFGPIPACMAALSAILYRIFMGGIGTIPGIATILTSFFVGLLWRRRFLGSPEKTRWLNALIMSFVAHFSMLCCMLLLPISQSITVIKEIALPVMLIYPITSVVLSILLVRQKERINLQNQLRIEKDKIHAYIEAAKVIFIVVDTNMNISLINAEGCNILGKEKSTVIGTNLINDYIPIENQSDYKMQVSKKLIGTDVSNQSFISPISDSNGHTYIISWNIALIENKIGSDKNVIFSGVNITDQAKAVEALQESERSKAVFISNIPGIAYRCNFDESWTMHFISQGCLELTGYPPEDLINNSKLSYNDIICDKYKAPVWQDWIYAVENKKRYKGEYEIQTALGDRKWVLEMGQAVYSSNDDVLALEGIIIDIDDSKRRYEQILYMNDHDFVTNLYNRRYFEKAKLEYDRYNNLPISIIVADINGLKLINDAFGHAIGDQLIVDAAEILTECLPYTAIIARTGGDEFSAILPKTSSDEITQFLDAIASKYELIIKKIVSGAVVSNISLGCSTKNSIDKDINIVEKEAEDNMYRHKLVDRESHHNSIIKSIMATMYAKSNETEEHAERLATLSTLLGEKINLPQQSIDYLKLVSMLHDIGKIGINDNILNKDGPLSDAEWKEMKKHPEIGYRIAMSSSELAPIAPFILYHHERWDGTGYPGGFSGESIPLLSRILSITDAYDAMTNDRTYRKAMSTSEAIRELEKNSGTQFDPYLTKMFIEVLTA